MGLKFKTEKTLIEEEHLFCSCGEEIFLYEGDTEVICPKCRRVFKKQSNNMWFWDDTYSCEFCNRHVDKVYESFDHFFYCKDCLMKRISTLKFEIDGSIDELKMLESSLEE